MEELFLPLSGGARRIRSLDPELVCYSWITGLSEVAQVVFVRKRLVEVQYLRTTISEEQRQEFLYLAESTVRKIETCHFPAHSGNRFPHNPWITCPFVGLCLAQQDLVESPLPVGLELALICLTSLRPMLPKLNCQRAQFGPKKIDEMLAWEQAKEAERDFKFVELGRCLCEVRAGQFW